MTRDDIIRMARDASCSGTHLLATAQELERFAELVAAAEREACAKVCDEQAEEPEFPERAAYCAEAIRARGGK